MVDTIKPKNMQRRRQASGPIKPPPKPKPSAAPPPEAEEATMEDLVKVAKASTTKVPKRRAEDMVIPTKIDMRNPATMVRHVVPAHVFRCASFKFEPKTFAVESESLNNRFVEPSLQTNSLRMFLADPRTKMIYGVAGNPDDLKAKYFAAYLVSEHIKALGLKSNVVWVPLYGGFDNALMDDSGRESPSMLVLTGLTPNSTNIKLEKARDLLEKYSEIPRVVVIAGMDPLSFLSTKLYVPANGIAYLAESLVRQKVEVI